jgi:hypothetical protein
LATLNLAVFKICAEYLHGLLGRIKGKNIEEMRTENGTEEMKER